MKESNRKSVNRKSKILLILLAIALGRVAAWAYTPVRPLKQLKEQDPARIVERAPESAQVVLPARFVRGKDGEIAGLQSLTNALWNGQILLQRELATEREGAAFVRAALAETKAQLAVADGIISSLAAEVDELRAVRDKADALRAWLIEQRDAAKLPTTKAIYQAIIDKLDEGLKGANDDATSLAS